jgi:hypothetical protein
MDVIPDQSTSSRSQLSASAESFAEDYPAIGAAAAGVDRRPFARLAAEIRRFGRSVIRAIQSPKGSLAWSTR